jgi:hypothetical protein
MQFHDGPNSECASNFTQSSTKSVTKTLTMIREAFGEERPNSRQKRHDRWRAKSEACSSFFWHQEDYPQRIRPGTQNNQFRILLWCFIATVKMWKDFGPNFDDKRTGCCIMTMQCLTLPFSPRIFFTNNNIIVIPHPSYSRLGPLGLSCFSDWR